MKHSFVNIKEAKANREKVAQIRTQEPGKLSDHEDLVALHRIELRKRQDADHIKRGVCPRCKGRILEGTCINCGYEI